MSTKITDVEDAMTVLNMDCYHFVLPKIETINVVSAKLLKYFHNKYCKKIIIDQTDNLYDKIIIQDIDCPNETNEMLCFKGFEFEHLVWLGMQKIYQDYIRFEKTKGAA